MGIYGLTSFITQRPQACMERYELHDTQLVIDGDSVAYQLYTMYFAPKNCCFGGDYDRYGDLVRTFFRTLFDCKITPYIIFDGGYEDRKMSTVLSRMKDRIKVAEKLNPTCSEIAFPLFLGETFKEIAIEFNVKVVRCDYEGDLESAKISKYLNCPVLSNDSDFYIFDVLYIPFTTLRLRSIWNLNKKNDSKYDKKNYKYIPCEMYRTDKFLDYIGLKKDLLPLFAVVLGNDYIKRRDFFNLFRQFNNGKVHPKEMNRHNLIQSLARFLNLETKESAIEKILAICNQTVQSKISETIQSTMEGYIINPEMPSEYLQYLDLESLTSKDSTDEKIKQFASRTGLSPEIISVFLNNFRRCLYPSCFMNILVENNYHIRPQVEETSLQNSHLVSLEIIGSIHKLLKPKSEQLKFFARVGENHEEHSVPFCNIDVPTVVDLESMDVNSRQQLLYTILAVDADFIDNCLNLFPNSWKLYILVINYLSTKSAISWSIIYSLLLCKIVINYVDNKINEFIRVPEIFYNKYKKSVCDILINKKANPDLANTIKDAVENVAYEDSLIALKNLVPFFQVKPELTKDISLFNRKLVHSTSQFQSCLYHVQFLNALLKSPFENCVISNCLNGTFVYNLTTEIRNRPNENYVKFLLQNSSTIMNCFNLMVICLKKYVSTDF